MKKSKKLIAFGIVIIVALFGIVYAVMPSKDIKYYMASQKKPLAESLMNVSGAKIKNNSLELTLNEKNINEVISSIDNLNEYRVVLNSDDADVYIPVTFMKLIKTNINVKLDIKAENNKLRLIVKESRLGKIKIDNKRVMKYVKEGTYNDIRVEKSANDIYVSNESLKFDDAYIKNNELFVKSHVDIKGIIDSLMNKIF